MDHTRLNNELGSVATSVGLTVPTNLLSGQQGEYTKLSKLSGKKFDKECVNLMVKDHVSDLSAFQKEASSTQDPKLRKAIATAIPVIREHLNRRSQTRASSRGVCRCGFDNDGRSHNCGFLSAARSGF